VPYFFVRKSATISEGVGPSDPELTEECKKTVAKELRGSTSKAGVARRTDDAFQIAIRSLYQCSLAIGLIRTPAEIAEAQIV
jgi:hypothetical protein